jgi:hypothetical protein
MAGVWELGFVPAGVMLAQANGNIFTASDVEPVQGFRIRSGRKTNNAIGKQLTSQQAPTITCHSGGNYLAGS